MKTRTPFRALLVSLLVVVLGTAGCASSQSMQDDASFNSEAELITYLEERTELQIRESGLVPPNALTGEGTQYRLIGDETLQVYTYGSAGAAVADAGQIDVNNFGALGAPTVYQEGRFIVAYFGDTVSVRSALRSAMDPVL